jgi:hypothetical protein
MSACLCSRGRLLRAKFDFCRIISATEAAATARALAKSNQILPAAAPKQCPKEATLFFRLLYGRERADKLLTCRTILDEVRARAGEKLSHGGGEKRPSNVNGMASWVFNMTSPRAPNNFLLRQLEAFCICCRHEGGHSDSKVVPALPGAHGGATQIHLDHFPVARVCRRTGRSSGEITAPCATQCSFECNYCSEHPVR